MMGVLESLESSEGVGEPERGESRVDGWMRVRGEGGTAALLRRRALLR